MEKSSLQPLESKPYFQLHFLVVILACTAILGKLIDLPAATLVFWRTLIAGAVLFIYLYAKVANRASLVSSPFRNKAILTGIILGAHWITFFGAIKLSNISICLCGMATTSLFTATIEAISEKRKPYSHEIILSLLIVPAIIFIIGVEPLHLLGMLCALASAALAATFTVINKSIVRQGANPATMTFHEMIGASTTCLIFILYSTGQISSSILPNSSDWFWLIILATFCTVYAFTLHIKLLKCFSAYETNLAINFEPVYGIILAAFLFSEHKHLNPLVFLGAFIIILVNLLNPAFARKSERRKMPSA